jgi:hypothetical protein
MLAGTVLAALVLTVGQTHDLENMYKITISK